MPRPCLGVLSLDTAFPRIPGDVGNPDSYPFDAILEVVPGADSPAIVRDAVLDEALMRRFEAAAKALERRGATAIVSTCGFLVGAQRRVAASVRVPVLLSALSLLPVVRVACPGPVGVLTASETALGRGLLGSAGIDRDDLAIAGMAHVPLFADTFLAPRDRQATRFDPTEMERAVVDVAVGLVEGTPEVEALILECGNLPPYAKAIRRATGRPVFHLVDAAALLVSAGGLEVDALQRAARM